MINSFYTAATGAVWHQKGLDITANNVANVSTAGYKADKASFSDLLYTNVNPPTDKNPDLKVGHGARVSKADTVFTEGNLRQTERNLDYALTGDGFFAVQTNSGVKYTRNGSFQLSQQSNGSFYLASANGGYVLNSKGQPIVVQNQSDNLDIGVYSFKNMDGLMKEGNTFFVSTERSGVATAVQNPELKRGFLEDSSVDLASEMADVITSQRAFQFNSRMVQVSDEIMQTVNSLR